MSNPEEFPEFSDEAIEYLLNAPQSEAEYDPIQVLEQDYKWRIAEVMQVLSEHALVPEGLDTDSLGHVELMALANNRDFGLRRFANRTINLISATEVAVEPAVGEDDYLTRTNLLEGYLGSIASENDSRLDWGRAAKDLFGHALSFPEDEMLDIYMSSLAFSYEQSVDNKLTTHPVLAQEKVSIRQLLAEAGSNNDETDAIVRGILYLSVSELLKADGERLTDDEAYAQITAGKKIEIDQQLVVGLLRRARKNLDRKN